jgi:hypothetical protein
MSGPSTSGNWKVTLLRDDVRSGEMAVYLDSGNYFTVRDAAYNTAQTLWGAIPNLIVRIEQQS